MKKDKTWLKREIHKELEDWHGVEGGIDGDGINEIMLLINQFEESKVKQLERKIKELDSYNDELIRDNNQLRSELDNQEVLSQEWIDGNSNGPRRSQYDQYVWVDDLKELLVPKQEDMFNGEKPDEGEVYFAIGLEGAVEINSARSIDEAIERLTEHDTSYNILKKPAIPKFIAEAIEEDKERGYDVYDSIDLIIETNGGGLPSISDWVAINIEKYARAWLDGYTVEEQKYYAKLKEIQPLEKEWLTNLSGPKYYVIDAKGLMLGEFLLDLVGMRTEASTKTLKDWERYGINNNNADFIKVEELEE